MNLQLDKKEQKKVMKKVLLIGDSIRISYQESVMKKLAKAAEVTGPKDNCRFAKYTLWCIKDWLNDDIDVIHWNNGIWDIHHRNESKTFSSLEDYVRDLNEILSIMKKTNAKIIWASTTSVAKECIDCDNDEIDKFNQAAINLMKKNSVVINDLNALVKNSNINLLKEDGLHLNEIGIEICAQNVSDIIMQYLHD